MAFDPQSFEFRSHGDAAPLEGRPATSGVAARMSAAAGCGRDDAELLARAAGGEAQAVEELYRRHARTVYRFAWALSGNDSLAADVVQDSFVALLDGPADRGGAQGFDPARGSVAAYLCGIARHLVYRRSRDRIDAVEDIEAVAESVRNARVPELPQDRLERLRALGQLHQGIRALPPHYRDVLVLVELQEMKYADAARVAGIEIGTVRSRLSRGKALLALWLSQHAADAPGGRP